MNLRFPVPVRRVVVGTSIAALAIAPGYAHARANAVFLAGYPLLKQQRSLTCESSAASMATRGHINEMQLMSVMPRSSNPNLGFRGNPNGVQDKTLADYGVYAAPLHRALLHYGYGSDVVTYGNDALLRSYLSRGWPVVVWITYNLLRETPRLGMANGVPFVLVPREHAILLVGYDGVSVYGNDPWTARLVRYRWADFNHSWGLFSNMALPVQPCAAPQPVTYIKARSVADGEIIWKWKPALNAAKYHVVLSIGSSKPQVLFQGDIAGTSFVFASARPHGGYLLTVTAIASCGITATGYGAWYWRAPAQPTSTPTPVIPRVTPTELATTPAPVTVTVAPISTPGSPLPTARPISTSTPYP